ACSYVVPHTFSTIRPATDADVAVALLTNGGHAGDLYQALFRDLLAELCDLDMPQPLGPADHPPVVDVSSYAGTYEREGQRIELEDHDGTLVGRVITTGPLAEIVDHPVDEIELTAVTDSVFVTRVEDETTWTPLVFYALEDGSPYLHAGLRASPRGEDQPG
ncbi:MAG: hypothetical protein WKF54_08360, partial [Nocardioidaceae bacterium]